MRSSFDPFVRYFIFDSYFILYATTFDRSVRRIHNVPTRPALTAATAKKDSVRDLILAPALVILNYLITFTVKNCFTDHNLNEDIDECAETARLCQQNCANTWGSYQCSCQSGYTLASDNR